MLFEYRCVLWPLMWMCVGRATVFWETGQQMIDLANGRYKRKGSERRGAYTLTTHNSHVLSSVSGKMYKRMYAYSDSDILFTTPIASTTLLSPSLSLSFYLPVDITR